MDLSGLSSLSTALSPARNGDTQAILVQKKAMEIEAESAKALVDALPKVSSNPAHLGQNVDTRA